MTGFWPMLKKEFKEQLRTFRFLIVGGVFLLFGLTTPLTLKFLPDILKLSGEQIPIEIPPPTAVQSLSEYLSTIGQLGVLITVLVAMGAVANEIRHNTAMITLSKPLSYGAFINAKFVALASTFIASLAIASVFCYAYTVWLIGNTDIMSYVGANLLTGLFLIFCIATTLFCSSLFKSYIAAGGLAFAVLILLAALSAIPVVGDYLPGKLLSWGATLLEARAVSYWWSLSVTAIATVGLLFGAQRIMGNKEL